MTNGNIYEETINRIKQLETKFKVIYIWECEFNDLLANNTEINNFVRSLKIHKPINPRDALYGGRTDVMKTFAECKNNEIICYIDFNSSYPATNKYCENVIGHPIITSGHHNCIKKDLNTFKGLIKCTILPPNNLFLPVLPDRIDGKLLFHLCRQCAIEQNQNSNCSHTDEERAIDGTYVIAEVLLALEYGYKIIEIQELMEYQVSKNIFRKFISDLQAVKQQASGWPEGVKTTEEKSKFIEDYFETEGVRLDPLKIEYNAPLRNSAKLKLNSVWGKMAERSCREKTKICRTRSQLFSLIQSSSCEITAITDINPELILVTYFDHTLHPLNTANPVLAAYTLAYARINLYRYLDIFKTNAIYCDTDSIFGLCTDGKIPVKLSTNLGGMSNELEGYSKNAFIKRMVCCGCKSYAYEKI